MSVYTTIFASIDLDRPAWGHFAQTQSALWLPEGTHDMMPGEQLADEDDSLVVERTQRSWKLQLTGGLYRNLSRYLDTDLLRASEVGSVTGHIDDYCTDGNCCRSGVVFKDNGVVLRGSSECLNEAVDLYDDYEVQSLPSLRPGAEPVEFLVPPVVGNHQRTVVDTMPAPETVDESCYCGGFNYEADEPVCATLLCD